MAGGSQVRSSDRLRARREQGTGKDNAGIFCRSAKKGSSATHAPYVAEADLNGPARLDKTLVAFGRK
jgi:hypothetical protein